MPRVLFTKMSGRGGTLWITVMLFGLVAPFTGCNLCCPPYMDDYATIGGKWQRSHPSQGTVGSAFSDPGVVQAGSDEVYCGDEVLQGEAGYSEGTGEFVVPFSELPSDATTLEEGIQLDESKDSIIMLDE